MRLLSIRADRWDAKKKKKAAASIDETCPWINTGWGTFWRRLRQEECDGNENVWLKGGSRFFMLVFFFFFLRAFLSLIKVVQL